MKKRQHYFIFFGFILTIYLSSINGDMLKSLKESPSGFIIEEKRIIIPGYPDAFNPSIIRWYDNKLLLIFRARNKKNKKPNLIGFAWLDEKFEVTLPPILLTIYGENNRKLSRAQNPKLVRSGDIYYIAYNNIINNYDLETRRMVFSPLKYNGNQFYIENPEYLLNFPKDEESWREKNWSPFDFNGTLLFSYRLNPHLVLQPLMQNNECKEIASTEKKINWEWGEIHGGTPSILDDDHYLGFFHSWIDIKTEESTNEKISHYFIGAYCFENKYPFELTHISNTPIYSNNFYTSPTYKTWKPLKVVYPGGHVFDDHYIWVVYGKQDHECWVMKIDKQSLLNSLVPCRT